MDVGVGVSVAAGAAVPVSPGTGVGTGVGMAVAVGTVAAVGRGVRVGVGVNTTMAGPSVPVRVGNAVVVGARTGVIGVPVGVGAGRVFASTEGWVGTGVVLPIDGSKVAAPAHASALRTTSAAMITAPILCY